MMSNANSGPWPAADQAYSVSFRKRIAAALLAIACLGLRALRWLAPVGSATSKRAVILEPYGMGDVLSLLPLLKSLQQAGWAVSIVAKSEWRALIPSEYYQTWIPARIAWTSYQDNKKYRSLMRLWSGIVSIKSQLFEYHGAVGIDPRGDIRSIALLYILGCRMVASIGDYTGSDLAVSGFAATIVPAVRGVKRWRQILELSHSLGLLMSKTQEAPALPRCETISAENTIVIGIIPLAPWRGKLWPAGNWSEVICALRTKHHSVICLCGPGQIEDAQKQIGGQKMILVECENVEDWMKHLSQLRLLLTVDTGPMHLASALGIPTVSLFGVTPLPLWAPGGETSFVVHHQCDSDFRLCHQIESNNSQGTFWMQQITPSEVLQACEMTLSRGCSQSRDL